MPRWLAVALALLAAAMVLPLAWPLRHAFDPECWPGSATWGRVAVLMGNTLALAGGTVLLALPVGVALAVLLERTELPGRAWLLGLLVCPLAMPLPLWMSGWLLFAGTAPPLALAERMMPWLPGLGPAVLFHALAGLPWVVLICAWSLRRGGE